MLHTSTFCSVDIISNVLEPELQSVTLSWRHSADSAQFHSKFGYGLLFSDRSRRLREVYHSLVTSLYKPGKPRRRYPLYRIRRETVTGLGLSLKNCNFHFRHVTLV
jgi:hypothetical protein